MRRVHTDALLAKEVHEQRARLVVLVGEHSLLVLVLLHALNVLVKKVSRVEWSALGLRVKLCAEDGPSVVNQTLVGLVVQVGEKLPPATGEGRRIDGITMVLRCDVALSSSEVESRNVVSAVAVLELDGFGASSQCDQLVTHTNTHDGDLRAFKQFTEVIHCGVAVSWIARTVRDEDTVKVVSNLVDRIIEWEGRNTGTSRDQTTENVLLDTAIDQGNVHVTERGAHMERGLGAYPANEVDGLGVHEGLVLIGIVFLSDSDACQRRTLLTEVCNNLAGVYARNGGNTFGSTPLSKTLNSSPMAMLQSIVLNNDSRGLNMRRLEVAE